MQYSCAGAEQCWEHRPVCRCGHAFSHSRAAQALWASALLCWECSKSGMKETFPALVRKCNVCLSTGEGFYFQLALVLGSICPLVMLSDPKVCETIFPARFLQPMSVLEAGRGQADPGWLKIKKCVFQAFPFSLSMWFSLWIWRRTLLFTLPVQSN